MVVVCPKPRPDVNRIEPAKSPGEDGVVAETVTVWLAPGASFRLLGRTEPNGTNCSVSTCHGMFPFTPPWLVTALKMAPVQIPGTGEITSTLPKSAMPCGSVFAAYRPCGSTRIR